MPRSPKGYKRPESVACRLCGGPVAVAPRGNIAEVHPACGELDRALTRLRGALDGVATGRTPAELGRLAQWARGELTSTANHWVAMYARGAIKPAQAPVEAPRQAQLLGAQRPRRRASTTTTARPWGERNDKG